LITSTPVVIGAYLAGAVLLLGGLGVVLLPSLRQASLGFVACLLMVAVLAWLLDAPGLAAVQLALAAVAAVGLLLPPEFRSAGNRGRSPFSQLLIPGAAAAAAGLAVLAVLAILLIPGPWHPTEPGTGAGFGEYAVSVITAALVVLAALAGIVSWRPPQARQPAPIAPAGGRRKRGRP
jgi:NADH:ubiquinone oxidoreductase subunit 6 (subunit J)